MQFLGFIITFVVLATLGLGIPALFLYILFGKRKKSLPNEAIEAVAFPAGFGIASVGILLAYNLFAHEALFSTSFHIGVWAGLSGLALFSGLLYCYPKKQRTPLVWTITVVGILASFALTFRANGFVQSINVLAALACLGWSFALYSVKSPQWEINWLIRAKLEGVTQLAEHFVALLKTAFTRESSKQNKGARVLKTALITLVVVLVFIGLLSSADPIFKEMVDRILEQIVGRIFASLFIGFLLSFALSYHFRDKGISSNSFRLLGFYDLAVPASALILLFGVFLAIQSQYLFGGEASFVDLDITYSDYVRQGYLELLIATFFAMILSFTIYLGKKYAEQDRQKAILMGLNVLLIIELLAMLGSAYLRNQLYIDIFTLTRTRIIGMLFLAWLALVLVSMLSINIIKKADEKHFFSGALAASILVVALLNLINMDGMIASAQPKNKNLEKDIFYNSQLTTDAAQSWAESVETMNEYIDEIKTINPLRLSDTQGETFLEYQVASAALYKHVERLDEIPPVNLHFNSSESKALKELENKTSILGSNNTLSEDIVCLTGKIEYYQIKQNANLSWYDYNRFSKGFEYPFTSVKSYLNINGASSNQLIQHYLSENKDVKERFDSRIAKLRSEWEEAGNTGYYPNSSYEKHAQIEPVYKGMLLQLVAKAYPGCNIAY